MSRLSILDQGDFPHYSVSEHGMKFSADTPREAWLDSVKQLCAMFEGAALTKERTLMLLADALNWGSDKFGEEFAQAIDNTRAAIGLTPKTIANAQSTYKKIPAERRRDGLLLSHYHVIAAFEPKEQDRYMDQILQHKYTISDLKEVVAEEHPKTKRGAPRKTSEETEATALQKLEDVIEWIEGNGVGERWKIGLETIYKVFRRKWASGRKRR